MTAADYLKKPYGRVVMPDSDGFFRSEIIEFPGCIAVGDTAAEALANLERVAESWIEATLAKGQRIPDPVEHVGFSGKLVLRMPKTLHKKAAYVAAREGVSLNQFIITCIGEHVGSRTRAMQAVSVSGGQNYVLNIGLFAVPQPLLGTIGSHITVASGSQFIGLPIMAMQEPSHA